MIQHKLVKRCEWCEKPVAKRVAIRVVGKLFYVCKKCEQQKIKERGF
jgi:ribosome-binding protein aMBF1 (putative translation factor)